jgi:hypothetical protein
MWKIDLQKKSEMSVKWGLFGGERAKEGDGRM